MAQLRRPSGPIPEVLRWGARRVRVRPWPFADAVAHIAPEAGTDPLDAATVPGLCDVLAERGYTGAITSALGASDARAFEAAGFTLREHLVLLERPFDGPVAGPDRPVRRARRSEVATLAALDAASFASVWHLDGPGLHDALDATPASALFVLDGPAGAEGYAIAGRAGRQGFLQRLAVAPERRRQGAATALMAASLRWARRWRTRSMLVNTQTTNTAARALYAGAGFIERPDGLVVLERDLRAGRP